MTTYLVTRHTGFIDWIKRQDIRIDHCLAHLDIEQVKEGDQVIGTLPIHMVAALNTKGATYWHLELNTPIEWRGGELTLAMMEQLEPKLVCYSASKHQKERL